MRSVAVVAGAWRALTAPPIPGKALKALKAFAPSLAQWKCVPPCRRPR